MVPAEVHEAVGRDQDIHNHSKLIGRMGATAREYVRRNVLITRHLGDYRTLLTSFAGS